MPPNGSAGLEGTDKRTNSLAFSRTPCHTCASSDRTCDRRRPRCGTCLQAGVTCAGFATPLNWDNSRIWLGRGGDKEKRTRASGSVQSSNKTRFVDGHPHSRKRRATALGSAAVDSRGQHSATSKEERRSRPRSAIADSSNEMHYQDQEFSQSLFTDSGASLNPCQPASSSSAPESSGANLNGTQDLPSNMAGMNDFTDFLSTMYNPLLEPNFSAMLDSMSGEPNAWADFTSDLAGDSNWNLDLDALLLPDNRPQKSVPPEPVGEQTQPVNGGGQQEPVDDDRLINMYNNEFCVLPITSDVAANPFRPLQQEPVRSGLLSHAILALCFQHLNHQHGNLSAKVSENQEAALRLLEQALRDSPTPSLQLLDPMLILFTLDARICAASATGPWLEHLKRIKHLLKSAGGTQALRTSHIRSQVGMVIWWDATLALISRRGLNLDSTYLDYMRAHYSQDNWSFFDLTGCPGGLVVHLVRLAELAEQSELAHTKAWLTFDPSPVRKLFQDINAWRMDGYADACGTPEDPDTARRPGEEQITEDEMQLQQDRFHCAEAWRYALLLYIERVFFWPREEVSPIVIKSLARKTLDHVCACRRTSQLQKQLLLPVFLAASETGDKYLRQFATEYCRWWADCSRYNMFGTVPGLLDEIWAKDTGEHPQHWWGSVVDASNGSLGNDRLYLLG